ncbi:tRNA dimethylallyltransferase, mitochondrial [Emydomyces testavorans]|uniref:tRNA dimethylallyltransferase n=1 Tax=Emydomyces testavorans TaxID=2070801 RepID=A0AAF0DN53_9EURO|nr:tRNA dimethylallyltransferase, mitochondrial [Emydomyces testavorans]
MKPLIAVLGATGTGKSKLAVDLAVRFNGEIINGDAMQMYKGLPITTNQIPIEEREGIPHHLIACITLDQDPWRVGQFQKRCLKIIEEIRSRGKLPILVGGTHYYTQSVLFHEQLVDEENGEGENADPEYDEAAEMEQWPILKASTEEMLQKLREVDPAMAEHWHPNERRKIRRSLHIYLQTGRPASEIYTQQRMQLKSLLAKNDEHSLKEASDADANAETGHLRFATLLFWVDSDREILQQRLDDRVDAMIDHGLLSEAQQMFDYLKQKESQGLHVDRTRGVWVSIGFKELDPYISALSSGETSSEKLDKLREECIESVKSATRQYSRSQLKWIRGKLWNSLDVANAIDRLYILDSTNANDWKNSVFFPAERIADAFISGNSRPCPSEVSDVAKEFFETKTQKRRSISEIMEFKRKTCKMCNVVAVSEEQWKIHVKGRRHKNAVKAAEKKAQREEYFKRVREPSDG